MAFADVAKGRMEKSGEDPELLESIRGEAARIDRIVRGLLDYARPRDDTVAPYSPVDVLNRVRELLESQGKLDDLDAEWASLGDVPNVVMERHLLEQVMVNLLLNAVAALESTENPRISVDVWGEAGGVSLLPVKREHDPVGISYVHRRRVSQEDGGLGIDLIFNADRVAVIRVSDNGPGIPEEDRESVFDPFFTTKELGKGTGLGLSICARLVEGMGGRIHADNQEGGGAAFTIRLPGFSEKSDERGAEAQ
jgi:signal transduction histidine kinase